MSDWIVLFRPPFIYLILGMASLSAGVVWIYTGRARGRFNGWIYRAEDPTQYWWAVAVYLLGGMWFIGSFLHKLYILTQ